MPATYEPIATTTLGSNAASITVSSIPNTYTDIIAVLSNVRNATASPQRVTMRVNGDTGSNYSETRLVGNGSTASSSRNSNATWTYTGLSIQAVTSTTDPSMLITHFQNYGNTGVNKTFIHRGSASYSEVSSVVSLWRSTSAITSITYYWDGGDNFVSGTTVTLYGIKAA